MGISCIGCSLTKCFRWVLRPKRSLNRGHVTGPVSLGFKIISQIHGKYIRIGTRKPDLRIRYPETPDLLEDIKITRK